MRLAGPKRVPNGLGIFAFFWGFWLIFSGIFGDFSKKLLKNSIIAPGKNA